MEHGIEFKIGNVTKHSLTDWGVFLSPFDIPSAEVKTSYVDIEGADSSIDLTEVFGITYKDIHFSLQFTMIKCDYEAKLREIKAFLHGKIAHITTYRDVGYYYIGRCQINEFKCNRATGTLVVDVVAKPYKYKQAKTVVNLTVNGTLKHIFKNESMRVVPSFKCSSSMEIKFKEGTYSVGTNQVKLPNVIFGYGDNEVTFTGTGTVEVSYQEGAL